MPHSTQPFIKAFNSIARHKHRYTVFSDFVTLSAISIHNAICKNDDLEREYLEIIKRYSKEEASAFSQLLSELVLLLEPEPKDVLGGLYMALEIAEKNNGQFFTPPEISLLMAQMTYGNLIQNLKNDFITLSEPACGAGGMVLSFVNLMISHGYNPAKSIWVQCIDIDRVAALMCYLQLSLWNIPAQVVVGDTIRMKFSEVFHTPAHYLGLWDSKIKQKQNEQQAINLVTEPQTSPPPVQPRNKPMTELVQFDLQF